MLENDDFLQQRQCIVNSFSNEEVKSISSQSNGGEDAALLCSVQPYMQFAHY